MIFKDDLQVPVRGSPRSFWGLCSGFGDEDGSSLQLTHCSRIQHPKELLWVSSLWASGRTRAQVCELGRKARKPFVLLNLQASSVDSWCSVYAAISSTSGSALL